MFAAAALTATRVGYCVRDVAATTLNITKHKFLLARIIFFRITSVSFCRVTSVCS